jgi:hypothetical protein
MGLDQSSRPVEPLKEKRKGFRHTLAIRKAGRTDPDEIRVYRWLKAYLKPYPQSRTAPHRTPHPRVGPSGATATRRAASAHAAPAPRAGPQPARR